MAGDKVLAAQVSIGRGLSPADLLRVAATGMEVAAGGWVHRAGDVPLEDESIHIVVGIWNRNRRHQRLGVRMLRIRE